MAWNERIARRALEGVGDATLGEWVELGAYVFHLRRRISQEEQAVIGEAIDIRGTPEHERRIEVVKQKAPVLYELATRNGTFPR